MNTHKAELEELTIMLYEVAQLVGETSSIYKNLRKNIQAHIDKHYISKAEVLRAIGEKEIEIFPQINMLTKERLYGRQDGRNDLRTHIKSQLNLKEGETK